MEIQMKSHQMMHSPEVIEALRLAEEGKRKHHHHTEYYLDQDSCHGCECKYGERWSPQKEGEGVESENS